ncbi:MAG: hypothetical protein AAFQ54_14260 [Pseudomonadota bacterium]
MTNLIRRLALATAFAGLSMPAMALTIDAETDLNADGLLSLEEMQTAMPELTEEMFILIDITEDGLVDADELAQAEEAALLPVTDG